MTIERNGHTFVSGEELGFEKKYPPEIFAILNADTDAAYPIPETYQHAGMSQRLWLIGQCINAAANTIGMGATPQDIATKAIAIADCVFITLAKDGQV